MAFNYLLAVVISALFLLLGTTGGAAWNRASLLLYGGLIEDVYNGTAGNSAGPYRITRNLYATEKTGAFFGQPHVWIGVVAISDSRRDILVALRGTSNAGEWAKNLLVSQVPFPYLGGGRPGVHQGFLSLYTSSSDGQPSLRDQTLAELRSLVASSNSDYSVSFVGHSLGGALAVIAAFDVANSDLSGRKIGVYTFAAPMAGDESFRQMVSGSSDLTVLRVSDVRDVVPYLPSLNYVHVGEDMSVDGCGGDGGDDGGDVLSKVVMYHSIARYLRSIGSVGGQRGGGGVREKDLQGVMDFVKDIISNVQSGVSGFSNLVSAMKQYAQHFSAPCNI